MYCQLVLHTGEKRAEVACPRPLVWVTTGLSVSVSSPADLPSPPALLPAAMIQKNSEYTMVWETHAPIQQGDRARLSQQNLRDEVASARILAFLTSSGLPRHPTSPLCYSFLKIIFFTSKRMAVWCTLALFLSEVGSWPCLGPPIPFLRRMEMGLKTPLGPGL